MTCAWYVAETQPQTEELAYRHLKNNGFIDVNDALRGKTGRRVLFPRYRKLRKRRGITVEIARPLFPCYLLVELDLQNDRWHWLRRTFWIRQLLGNWAGDAVRPVALAPAVAERIVAECRDGPVDRPAYVVGQLVEIVGGPMAGEMASIKTARVGQAGLIVRLLRSGYAATLPEGQVQAV